MGRTARLFVLIGALLLAGCCPARFGTRALTGSGRLVDRDLDLSGFSRIEAGTAFQLDISRADSFSVTITADDNVIDDVEVGTADGTLRLRLRPGASVIRATLRARITMPGLRALSLSGAAGATLTGFSSDESLDLDVSGASDLRGDARAGDTRLTISGAGQVDLDGGGRSLSIQGSGASSADLLEYPVGDADVRLSGGSRALVNASGTLDADLSGGSSLEYAGNPTLRRVETSGGSTIRPH
ncbi:MAG: head GIN domain-containing protein [Anaerolineae bacterium]|nr:head GIN domain-containing protein [Anaerolineae bacterium]